MKQKLWMKLRTYIRLLNSNKKFTHEEIFFIYYIQHTIKFYFFTKYRKRKTLFRKIII